MRKITEREDLENVCRPARNGGAYSSSSVSSVNDYALVSSSFSALCWIVLHLSSIPVHSSGIPVTNFALNSLQITTPLTVYPSLSSHSVLYQFQSCHISRSEWLKFVEFVYPRLERTFTSTRLVLLLLVLAGGHP